MSFPDAPLRCLEGSTRLPYLPATSKNRGSCGEAWSPLQCRQRQHLEAGSRCLDPLSSTCPAVLARSCGTLRPDESSPAVQGGRFDGTKFLLEPKSKLEPARREKCTCSIMQLPLFRLLVPSSHVPDLPASSGSRQCPQSISSIRIR